MTTKTISYDLNKVDSGVDKIADVVKATVGPCGRNIGAIEGTSKIINTKDGVSVAKKVVPLADKVENYAAQIVKKAADQAVEKAGDGTTTTCILTQAIYKEAKQILSLSDEPTAKFCRDLQSTVNKIVNDIDATNVDPDSDNFRNVVSISTNGDQELTDIVVDAFKQVGKDGIITIEKARGRDTELEKVEGLCFDQGYCSPYFVTNQDKMLVQYESDATGNGAPLILLYNGELRTADPILHLVEAAVHQKRPFVVIALDVVGECLATLIVNRIKANMPFLAIKAPGYGTACNQWLHDISMITGAHVVDPKVDDLKELGANILGSCQKIVSEVRQTTIVGNQAQSEAVKEHIRVLEEQVKTEINDYYKEKTEERIARLKNGVTIIHLAAFNEIEAQEKTDRLDDAIKAGKAALKEGIVPGCGVAYIRAANKLGNSLHEQALKRALRAPTAQILENVGKSEKEIKDAIDSLDSKVINIKDTQVHFSEQQDLIEVADPKLVVSTALEEATSAACILINTKAVIIENDEQKACTCNQ